MKQLNNIKLCTMMFLQFMLVAVFWVQLSSYLDNMKITGIMMSLIMSSMAVGSVFSPVIGAVADRIANGERVLAGLNATVAAALLMAYFSTSPAGIFASLTLAMCAYMPSWGLTTTIAMRHSSAESFPFIRVFGSLGWVCSAVFALSAKYFFGTNIDGTATPLACAAAVALLAALLNLTLPATPPSGKNEKFSPLDTLGFGALKILRDKNMAVLVVCEIIYTLAFSIYWMYGSFLSSLGVENITPVLNLGQISEMLFMLALPFSVKYLGIKKTIILGLAAMCARYVASMFGYVSSAFYISSICLHGLVFGFFVIAAQIYIGKKAPADIQAQAQGFFYFVFGVAQIAGTFFSVWLIDANTTLSGAAASTNWHGVFLVEALISAAVLALFAAAFKSEKLATSK